MPNKPAQPQEPIGWDSIDFVPTDLDEARAALEEPPAGVKILKSLDKVHWQKQRRASQPFDTRLTDTAYVWLAELPPESRPIDLLRAYPRIVNKLAEAWPNADNTLQMLDDLVVDRRGDRRGFPSRVALEIVALRDLRATQARARR